MKNIAIIGAGASGLFLSKMLTHNPHHHVYLFEKNKRVGSKLCASGGGKANIANLNITAEGYNRPDFVAKLLQKITPAQLLKEFFRFGLPTIADEEGRVYPITEFSQTVVDVLFNPESDHLHCELEYEVGTLKAEYGKWRINSYPVAFDNVVICSGSPANMIAKNRTGYNHFLQALQLKSNPIEPSLVGFRIKDYPKTLSGCRVKVKATLWQENQLIYEEPGEVIFKDDGLSGIVILNLSARYRWLENHDNCQIVLDLLPQHPEYDVTTHWRTHHTLKGVLHPKLNKLYEKRPFDLHHWSMKISETYEIDYAQVCHGGVDVSEVNGQFESVKHPGLFLTGEVLDIDGICGGYNLFFAFASAWIVANALK